MMNQPPDKSLAGARYRGLLIIWGAQVFSLVLFFVIAQVISPTTSAGGTQPLLLALAATALTTFALSFIVKPRLLARAAAERRPDLVTTGYIIAFALCESCAIFGLVAHFTTGAREAYYFFVPAALGFLLHFPRRRHFDDADGNNGAGQGFKSTF
jgi:F0F1-type ATP synthase membrane subunit c/vacuolar-type H+-ATPase subunit K